jgi:ABC-type phosphate transport system substrate-binding protein
MKSTFITLAVSACLALPASAQVIIVSAKNPISKMTKEQAAQIFLGQARSFITGGQAEALDLAEDAPLRKAFYQAVTNKAPAQMKAHWSKMEFSGSGHAPKALATSAEIVKQVSENPKYIAYVEASAVTPGVKVVLAL